MAVLRVLTTEQRRSNTHNPGDSDPKNRTIGMNLPAQPESLGKGFNRLSTRSGSACGVFFIARSTILSYLGSSFATLLALDSRTDDCETIRVAPGLPQRSHAIVSGRCAIVHQWDVISPHSPQRNS
jgi:hypothetical protein